MIRVGGARLRVLTAILGTAAGAMTGCGAFISWDLPAVAPGEDAGVDDGGTDGDGSSPDSPGDRDGTGGGLADALVDVGDASCLCAPALPDAGWTGPWIVSEQSAKALPAGWPPACADGAAPSPLYGDLEAGPATCSCSCSYSTVAKCDATTLTVFKGTRNTTGCDAGAGEPYTLTTCTAISNYVEVNDSFIAAASPQPGSCTGGAPIVDRPPPVYATIGAACPGVAAVAGVCAAGAACVLAAPGSTLCIAQDPGAKRSPCPKDFPHPRVYATDNNAWNDARDCTACACDEVPNSCTGSAVLGSGSCGTPVEQVALSPACKHLAQGTPADVARSTSGNLPQGVGGCAPNPAGGQPTGGVTPVSPVTYCCL